MKAIDDRGSLQMLLDREAIRDCMYRYCRGIDRLDEKLLRSVYWPDATDRHGAYAGTASGFVDQVIGKLKRGGRRVHMLGNILIELHSPSAAVESYFQAFQTQRDEAGQLRETFLCGRYVDRFEKRGDEWRVAARTVTYDWIRQAPMQDGADDEIFGLRKPVGQRMPADPIYALLKEPPFFRA